MNLAKIDTHYKKQIEILINSKNDHLIDSDSRSLLEEK